MVEEGLPAKASDYTRALSFIPHHHADWQAKTRRNTIAWCSQLRETSFLANWREELGGSYSLLKWVVSTKYFFAWKKVSNSRGFSQTVKLSNLLLIEVHLASLSGAGNRDLGFRLSLLRINFLFSAKGYLPHFVLSIIHGCTCWPF